MGSELIQAGIIAVVVSVFLMLVYIWFRFELPFAIGAVIALIHDVVLSLGSSRRSDSNSICPLSPRFCSSSVTR